LIFKGFLF